MKGVNISGARVMARIWIKMGLLAVVAGAVLRIALACHPVTVASSLSVWQWIGVFALGAVNDAAVMAVLLVPLGLFLLSSGEKRFRKPWSFVCIGAVVLLWIWVKFGATTLREFNSGLARAVGWVIVYWIVSLLLRVFVPRIRRGWMTCWTAVILFIYLFIYIGNVCAEWIFWDEFGVRYNFIAVDYLVYTSEVVGNIMQSYAMGWIISAVAVAAAVTEWLLLRKEIAATAYISAPGWRWRGAVICLVPAAIGAAFLPLIAMTQRSDNPWYNELQASGPYSFIEAFRSNSLDYDDFYLTIDDNTATPILAEMLKMPSDSLKHSDIMPNIVLITMESMSADYMQHFGNDKGLTPVMDSLWNESLSFERMFAAGNRTVRGLEAITLSRPPSPAESIIKRPDEGKTYPSIADALKHMGYECSFYYGGDAYFDNMEHFFSGLGYTVRDRKSMNEDEVTCATVWGACDGDVYRRVLTDLDKARTPQMMHIMTTSNHRPYIYPEGCVSIPPTQKSRDGAVMYSDYALGQFITEAKGHQWFDNTIFVIVADHCASSAGSTELPIEKYHIPAMIYAPWLLKPQTIEAVASQIDIFPTLFALMGLDSDSRLYGRNILAPTFRQRAYIATYQDLGYLENDTLTVLSPGRRVRQFAVTPTADNPYALTPVATPEQGHVNRAVAIYSKASRE